VFIEALACEAVVVTSDIVPMTEYITSSENGILVKDYEDPEALARAVASACKDADLRAVIKARARKSVERFQKEKVDALEVEYYQRAMKIGPSVLGFAEKFYDRAQNKLSKIKKRLSA
jgi:glycosyltransferase involved in cell wall biosynthesis